VLDATTGSTVYTLYGRDAGFSFFGSAVSMSESYLIVGGYGSSGGGSAAVYSLSTGTRLYTKFNTNLYGTTSLDYFGRRVAITESYAVVSAPQEDNASGTNSGAVYIYNVADGTLAYSIASPNTASVQFGTSMSANGDTLIVGAPYGSGNGVAYIYSLSTGTLLQTINCPDSYASTSTSPYRFGYGVAISDNYFVVTSINEQVVAGSHFQGAVYVFNRSDYSLIRSFLNPGGAKSGNAASGNGDYYFGWGLAMTDRQIVISEAYYGSGKFEGIAYAFKLDDGQLINTFSPPSATLDYVFGSGVATYGDYIVIGAKWWSVANPTTTDQAGHINVYKT
jgi:hypothetical protein